MRKIGHRVSGPRGRQSLMRYLALLGGVVVILCGVQARADDQAPNEFSFGIGVGYAFPADLRTPNIVSTSFYYKGIEIQPSVTFQNTTDTNDDGVTKSTDTQKTSGVGATFKYPFARRNNVDLQLIGSLNYSRSTDNPDGPNNTTNSKSTSASYGLGLQWWFAPHFSFVATATNPIYETTWTRAEDIGGATVTTDRSYGIVWDPKVSISVMTWF